MEGDVFRGKKNYSKCQDTYNYFAKEHIQDT